VKRFYSPLAPNPIKKSEGQKISVLIPGKLERESGGRIVFDETHAHHH
jgi:hypothetical protein